MHAESTAEEAGYPGSSGIKVSPKLEVGNWVNFKT